jgi:hypothetical protein
MVAAQGSISLTPAGGLLAIIAGVLIIFMVGPTLSGPDLLLEQLVVYGFSIFLIAWGAVTIYSAIR